MLQLESRRNSYMYMPSEIIKVNILNDVLRNTKAKYCKQSESVDNGYGRRWKEIIIDQNEGRLVESGRTERWLVMRARVTQRTRERKMNRGRLRGRWIEKRRS